MKISGFRIDKRLVKRGFQDGKPFLIVSGEGCGITGCGCSGDYFVSVSTGKQGVLIHLTPSEFRRLGDAFVHKRLVKFE